MPPSEFPLRNQFFFSIQRDTRRWPALEAGDGSAAVILHGPRIAVVKVARLGTERGLANIDRDPTSVAQPLLNPAS